ncbi:MAG: hypothetical protein KBD00_04965 [Candidatus Peribacteraceae bacterium]|nr:hypothetical protein [Candidatus Peribacteraceae bacterium]
MPSFETPRAPLASLQKALQTPAKIRDMAENAGENTKERLKEIEDKAKKIYERLASMQEAGDTWDNMTPLFHEMGALYNQATNLRMREIGTTNLATEVETAFSDDSKDQKVLREALVEIARKADIDPTTITTSSSAADRGFFIPTQDRKTKEQSFLVINTAQRNDALTLIETHLNKNISLTQPQREALFKLKARLNAILQTNRVAALDDAVGKAINRQGTNYRPLRLLGAVGGSVLTAIGLGVFFRTGKLPWPTLLWGFVAAASANPDLLKSRSFQTLKKYQFLTDSQTQKFLHDNAIDGPEGAAHVQEFFDQSPATKSNLLKLTKEGGPIDEESLKGAGVDGTLLTFMLSLPNSTERGAFIRLFASIKDKEVQIKTVDYVKHRRDPVV